MDYSPALQANLQAIINKNSANGLTGSTDEIIQLCTVTAEQCTAQAREIILIFLRKNIIKKNASIEKTEHQIYKKLEKIKKESNDLCHRVLKNHVKSENLRPQSLAIFKEKLDAQLKNLWCNQLQPELLKLYYGKETHKIAKSAKTISICAIFISIAVPLISNWPIILAHLKMFV